MMTMASKFKNLFTLVLVIFCSFTTAYAAAKNNCYSASELNDFKEIYISGLKTGKGLQQQLNYEGTDAYLDKNFKVQTKPHAPGTPYGGKEFEDAIFAEYQNSLRKVGRLYQAAKFENDDSFKSNELLVKFMQAIEDKSTDSSEFIQQTKVKEVINALEEASKKKFGATNKKFVLNDGDKYLLEKLLTHATDRICNIATYEKTGKDTNHFKVDYLQKVKNAPLNRLVNTIKHASISKDSVIDLNASPEVTGSLIDPTVAVKSAIADNMTQLSEWVKKVKARGDNCLAMLKSKDFANAIQDNVQSCNLGYLVETLSGTNVSNLEAVLHYINSNERYRNSAQAKAETGMDELKLESMIDKTFANLGTKITCSMVDSPTGIKKIFVRNLPFINNKFDSSKVSCKIKGKEIKASDCAQKIEFVSDDLGRGLEVRQKAKSGAAISLSIKENPDCSDLGLGDEEPAVKDPKPETPLLTKSETKTGDQCEMEGKKLDPPQILIPNADKTGCIPKANILKDIPSSIKVLEEKDLKLDTKILIDLGQEKFFCDLRNSQGDKMYVYDEKNKECKEAGTPAEKCVAEGNAKTPKVVMELDKLGKCVEVKKSGDSDAKKLCEEKQKNFIKEGGHHSKVMFRWIEDKGICEERDSGKDNGKKSKEDTEEEAEEVNFPPKVIPQDPPLLPYSTGGRMWISPGAP